MPIVIPAAPGSSSTLQTVPTQQVFDYVYDSQSNPLKGVQVVITLSVELATSVTPQVVLSNTRITVTTDQNGFWTVNLIPNANINPANTTYTVQPPSIPAYQINIPSGGGPFQSTSPSVLVNTPGVLAPATTGITGNLTVTGNESVTGTLSVGGTTTLAGASTGALTTGTISTGAATIGGDLTIASAFRLLLGAAVSKLVPGLTSFSIRDNADANDNLIVTNAGAVTVRAGLTATAGGLIATAGDILATAGRFVLGTATSKIVPGATSLSLRNHADNADNLILTDAGLATLRNTLSLTAGGHLLSIGGSLPTVGTLNANVSVATVNSGSTDTAGSVTFTTTGSVAANQQLFIVSFATAYANAPIVVCTGGPQFANAVVAIGTSTTGFGVFSTQSIGAAAGQQIQWVAIGK